MSETKHDAAADKLRRWIDNQGFTPRERTAFFLGVQLSASQVVELVDVIQAVLLPDGAPKDPANEN